MNAVVRASGPARADVCHSPTFRQPAGRPQADGRRRSRAPSARLLPPLTESQKSALQGRVWLGKRAALSGGSVIVNRQVRGFDKPLSKAQGGLAFTKTVCVLYPRLPTVLKSLAP